MCLFVEPHPFPLMFYWYLLKMVLFTLNKSSKAVNAFFLSDNRLLRILPIVNLLTDSCTLKITKTEFGLHI